MGKGGQDEGMPSPPRPASGASPVDCFPAWARDEAECEAHYKVSMEQGLSWEEAERRREIYGLNELERHEGPSVWRLILDQFEDTLVRILLVAAVVSFVLAWYDGDEGGEMGITAFVEPLVIFLILIANAVVGVWQESNAEKALEALKRIQSETAMVMREGAFVPSLPAAELVPGDIVELRVGDKVPADMRILKLISSTVRVEQGSLTGESVTVNKTHHRVEEDADIQGKECMVFAGTTVVNGCCICVVTQTGMNTEIGKVHSQIHEASQTDEDTPLKKKLNEFGEALTAIIGVICALVWLINVKYFFTWEYVNGWPANFKFSFEKCTYYFEIAVALAVAAIPEGLPAVITTCLALGTRKMAQKNALVRKLPSVETLGCTTVICSDKTGTLTTNQNSVAKLVAMGRTPESTRTFRVEGTTYDPSDGKILDWPVGELDPNLQMVAKIAALCNDAGIAKTGNQFSANGMPTEAALKVLVEKMGLPPGSSKITSMRTSSRLDATEVYLGCCKWWSHQEHRIATLEFDRMRKSMGVIVKSKSGKNTLLVKGAVENLLERSSYIQLLDGSVTVLDDGTRKHILSTLHDMSSSALRCLGFAYKEELSEFATYDGENHPAHKILLDPSNYPAIETALIFVGLAGLRDPPRQEVHNAIEDCRAAGIKVMVITGDNKHTAEAICREIGIFSPNEDILRKSITGREFMTYSNEERLKILRQPGGLLFSRAEPRHKQEIVKLLKADGEVVAMTGDGVNDAPALKKADIGIAVADATDAARSASDIVLTEPGLSVIISAVLTSRAIFQRMKNYTIYAVSITIRIVLGFMLLALIWKFDFPPFMVLIIAILNDGTIMTISKDRVKPSPLPDSWKLAEIFATGIILGGYLAMMTVIFFWAAYKTDFFPRIFHVSSLQDTARDDFRKLASAIYLQVSTISQALIFVTRSRSWSFVERPGLLLVSAFVIAQLVATLIAVYANWSFAAIEGIGWGWAGVVWLYNLIFYIPLDFIKFIIRYALSGRAWDLMLEQRIAFTRQKDFGKEARELKWAHAQRTLHGLHPPDTKMFSERTGAELNQMAEEARRRAEIARLRELHTLKGHVESVVRLKGLDIGTIQQAYTV